MNALNLDTMPPQTRTLIAKHMNENAGGPDRIAAAMRQVNELIDLLVKVERELIEAQETINGVKGADEGGVP